MTVFIGALLILWGVFILYSSSLRMKKEEFKDKGVIGASGYIEMEFLFRLLSRVPYGVIKGFVLLIGTSFITLGTYILSSHIVV
ncbi:hypothetical protein MUO14_22435 [Halobacillus shinanisalinarum]|uniref:Uncharacterized protein n=1 Tax=Halobacillus shinanisalinarum TaxID=2932258 RepID=A0ABY4GY41_9BACI|nr:hypothetical protein [Halobacillus shinanisalinarum]UOQ93115.1 hypothetical protein MUO14_22435 [Halobacillus shinanisalinarum]